MEKYFNNKIIQIIFIIFICLIFFSFFLLQKKFIFIQGDVWRSFYPYKVYHQKVIEGKESILWNPYLFSGTPALATPEMGLIYPPDVLILLLKPDIENFFRISYIFHFFVLFLGIYILCREYAFSKKGSFYSAIAGTFSGLLIFTLINGQYTIFNAYCWGIWILAVLIRFLKNNDFLVSLTIPPLTFLLFTAGHIQITFIFFISSLIISIYYFITKRYILNIKYYIYILFLLFITILFLMPQLLPTLNFIKYSNRGINFYYKHFTEFSFHPTQLLTVIDPALLGRMADGSYWKILWRKSTEWENPILYLGFISICLLLISDINFWKQKKNTLIYILIFTGLFLAFGRYNPLYYIFYKIMPIKSFRAPSRFLFIALPGFYLLLAAIIDWDSKKQKKSLFKLKILKILLLTSLLILVFPLTILSDYTLHLLQFIINKFYKMCSTGVYPLEHYYSFIPLIIKNLKHTFIIVFFASFSVLLYSYLLNASKKNIAYFLIIVCISIELLFSINGYLLTFKSLSLKIPYLKSIKDKNKKRLLSYFDNTNVEFSQNHPIIGELYTIKGYNPLVLKNYVHYLSLIEIEPSNTFRNIPINKPNYKSYLAQALNIDVLISPFPIKDKVYLEKIKGNSFHNIYIYKLKFSFPEFYIAKKIIGLPKNKLNKVLSEPYALKKYKRCIFYDNSISIPKKKISYSDNEQFFLIEKKSDKYSFSVNFKNEQILFISVPYYSQWKAYTKSKKLITFPANGPLTGIILPEGTYTFTFEYSSNLIKYGLIGLCISILILCLLIIKIKIMKYL